MSAFSINKDDTSIYGYLLGLLNSPLGDYIFNMLNPTISLQVGNFSNFPVLQVEPRDETGIYDLVHSSVSLTKADWNAFETAWGFQSHKFSYHIAEHPLSHPQKIAHYCPYVPNLRQLLEKYEWRVEIYG